MSGKKAVTAAVILVIAIIIIPVIIVYSWTVTPYGRLDPRVAIFLKLAELSGKDPFLEGRPLPEVRKLVREGRALVSASPAALPEVRNTEIPGPAGPIPVRIYVPEGTQPFPVVIYFHGGGWTIGDLDSHDNVCRKLASKVPAVVMSVDYRLAPEHPYPAAVDDAFASVKWACAGAAAIKGDPKLVAVAGDSAGGNLSAVVSRLARDRGLKLAAQVLIYPATNLSSFDTGSHKKFSKGYFLTREIVEKLLSYYAPDKSKWTDPMLSPLLAKEFRNLPPALVLTAGFDVLHDEGLAYADKLEAAGVPVTAKNFPGMIHGFINMDRIFPAADDAIDECALFLRTVLR